jgi:D-sedoheptulose 7-phosphate isomerase
MKKLEKESYEAKYFENIYEGLIKTTYQIEGIDVSTSFFFESLKKIIDIEIKPNGRFFFFGNGASAAFSNHMALDWSKNGGVNSFSLSDSSYLTALANDYSYDEAFLEYLKINKPNSEDLIITTSSSGNSKNILSVLEYCQLNNIKTLSFSGLNANNNSVKLSNYSIFCPLKTYGMVECLHQVLHHLLLDKSMNIEEWCKNEAQNMDSNNFKL